MAIFPFLTCLHMEKERKRVSGLRLFKSNGLNDLLQFPWDISKTMKKVFMYNGFAMKYGATSRKFKGKNPFFIWMHGA